MLYSLEMEDQTDLISRITAPPSTLPVADSIPAKIVTQTELLNGEATSVATAPTTFFEVGESDLLGNVPPTPPAPANVPPETPKKRGPGRPPGSKNKRPGNASGEAPSNTPELFNEAESVSQVPNIGDLQAAAEVVNVDYVLMADATFDMSAGILATTLGPEWNPKSPEERDMICKPLATYYKSKGVQDLPPGLMLTIVICAYAAPRMREPSTSSKLRVFWAWLKERVRRKP